jgi:hypothetical protein
MAKVGKKTPHVPRPARTPGAAKPPVIPGATSGTIRQRAHADGTWNATGKAAPSLEQAPVKPAGNGK